MVNERSEAVSIAFHYFVLVDNLVPGFKAHLAKNVILKWFGKDIKGKRNVVKFLLSDSRKSEHIFNNIVPTSDIWERKYWENLKQSADPNIAAEESDTNSDTSSSSSSSSSMNSSSTSTCSMSSHTKGETSSEIDTSTNVECDANLTSSSKQKQEDDTSNMDLVISAVSKSLDETYIDASTVCGYVDDQVDKNKDDTNATTELNDECYDLNESDLRNLEPEITSPTGEEDINRIKLKEEMTPTIATINRKSDQEVRPIAAVKTGTKKYLQAIGKVTLKSTNISKSKDFKFGYYWPRQVKICKRMCKLQIAYSIVNKSTKKNDNSERIHSSPTVVQCDAKETKNNTKKEMERKDELLFLDKFVIANTSIPYINCLNGHLKPVQFFHHRKEFLQDFEADMIKNEILNHISARSKRHNLIFKYPNKRSFPVTYKIHMIIYKNYKNYNFKKSKKNKAEHKTKENDTVKTEEENKTQTKIENTNKIQIEKIIKASTSKNYSDKEINMSE